MRLAAFVFTQPAEDSATLAGLGESRSDRARRAYFDVVRAELVSAGGSELSTVDDGVLSVFESVSEAFSFAGAVQRGCERESRRAGERLDVRIGIDVGEARSALDVEAGAASRARQLAQAADGGTTLASQIAATLATSAAALSVPAGLFDLPGTDEPVPAVELVWKRRASEQAPLPAELEITGSGPPFVGRRAERSRLGAVWGLALRGERQLAFVVGEPGIGKTRLVAEFARSLHDEGAAVLWGRSFEEALRPYQPIVHALQHHVRCTPPEELREQVGGTAGVLARLLPELPARLGVTGAPLEDAEGDRYRLFEAVDRLLVAVSAERPLLLVLDDLQWADQGTLLLLKRLARDPGRAQILLLGTYRHSEVAREHPLAHVHADVARDRVVERIELAGLDEDEVGTLVGSLVGWDPPEAVVRGLRGKTEGNPLFLVELVRHLGEFDLSEDPEQLARVEEVGVPARVRELVARRVQRLSPAARAILSAAAVMGSEFDSDVLAEVLDAASPAHLVDALDEAVAGRLLVESPDRVGRYGFSHALIQEALYEEQTLNHRAAFHEQAAAALERLRPGDRMPHAALAYHFARAGDRYAAKVVQHGRVAGEQALAVSAYEDAIRELSAALAASNLLPEADRRERAELLTLLGTARTRCGEAVAGRAAFGEAAEIAAATGMWRTLTRAALGYGGGTNFGGVWEAVSTVDDELVRLLEHALDVCPVADSQERVRLLGRLAQALYWTPERERALRLSDEAVVRARRVGDPAALAYALDSRHVVLWDPDNLDEGRALAEEMLTLGREIGDGEIQLEALAWLITDALERGSIVALDELIAEHGRIAAELRLPYHLWFTDALRMMRAHLDGRLEEADELCRRAHAYGAAFALSAQGHGSNALQVYLIQALFVWLEQGRAEEALDELRQRGAVWPVAVRRAATALCLASLGRREEALELVGLFAEEGFGEIPRDALWMTTMVALSRAVADLDDPTHADELYRLLLPYADRICVVGGAVLCLGPASWILGMLARAAGKSTLALDQLADALGRSRDLGSPPFLARAQLEAAKAHLLRDGPDDRAAAGRLLDEASEIASGLAMRKLGGDVDALRGSPAEGVRA